MSKSSLVSLMFVMIILSSCAVYSTGFNCADSKGARCVMLSKVDNMVFYDGLKYNLGILEYSE